MSEDTELKVVLGGDATQLQTALEAGAGSAEEFAEASAAAMTAAAEASVAYSEQVSAAMGHATEATHEHASAVVRGMESITESIAGVRSKLSVFGEMATEISELVLVGFGLEKVADFMKEFGEAGEEISHTAIIMGQTVEQTSQLENASKIAGVSFEGLQRSVNKFGVELNAADGPSKNVQKSLDELGIQLDDIKGKTPQDQLLILSDAFVRLKEEGVNPTSIGLELFGQRVGAQMIPFLLRGSEGIRELEEESDKLGGTWTAEMAAAAEQVAKGFNDAAVASSGMAHRLALELAPATNGMTALWADLTREGGALDTVLKALAVGVEYVSEVIVAAVTGFVELWEVVKFGVEVLTQSTIAIVQMGSALAHLDLAGAKQAWHTYTDAVSDDFKKMSENIAGENADLQKTLSHALPKPETMPDGKGGDNIQEMNQNDLKNVEVWQKGLDRMLAAKQLFGEQAKAAERDYWQGIISNLEAGTADYEAVQNKLYQVQSELNRKAEADAKRSAEEIASQKKAMDAQQLKEAEESVKNVQKQIEQTNQVNQIEESSYQSHIDAMAKLQEKGIEESLKMGEISKKQEVDQLTELENQRYSQLMDELLREEQLYADQPVKVAQINAQIEKLQDQHAANMQSINEKLEDKSFLNSFNGMVNSMASSWSSGIDKMLQGTESFANFAKNSWNSMVSDAISSITKMVIQHTLGENLKTAATEEGEAEQLAIRLWSSAESLAVSAAEAVKQIAISAYTAMAGAYAAIAAIPYVGPFLAPAAAAAAGVAVFEIGSSIASASGGYDIPSGVNPMTQLHAREMVLPAPIAETVRSAMSNGGGGGGGHTFHYHAAPGESAKSVTENTSAFMAAGRKAMRSFSR